jgi:phage shock protein E
MKSQLIKWFAFVAMATSFAPLAADITQEELLKRMQSADKPMILDVRTVKEFNQGHVPGAINVPHKQIKKRLAGLKMIKDKTIILYCHSGTRAGIAKKLLAKNGFDKLDHLVGDYKAWHKKGLPEDKGAVASKNTKTVSNPCGL